MFLLAVSGVAGAATVDVWVEGEAVDDGAEVDLSDVEPSADGVYVAEIEAESDAGLSSVSVEHEGSTSIDGAEGESYVANKSLVVPSGSSTLIVTAVDGDGEETTVEATLRRGYDDTSDVRSRVDELQSEVDEIESEIQELNETRREYETENDELRTEIDDLEDELDGDEAQPGFSVAAAFAALVAFGLSRRRR
ncbi:MAG: hypothetical protein ACOCT0_02045 [Halobacteriota archaeon]